MIPSKNKAGFTLIETMVAVAIMGVVLTPILMTQSILFQSVVNMGSRLQYTFLAESFLIDARQEAGDAQKFNFEKKIESPAVTLKYELGPIPKNSKMSSIKGLLQEKIIILAQGSEDVLVNFIFKPKVSKKNE